MTKPVLVIKHCIGYDVVVNQETGGGWCWGIRCHVCGRTSYHPKDVQEHYCSACHIFHDDVVTKS
jgi:hypothetical protein